MTIEVRLTEWQELGPDVTPLRGLTLVDHSSRMLAEQLTRKGILEVEELRAGVRVRARAHVGRVLVDPLVVTVEPKVGGADLLELVRYAYSLPPLHQSGVVDVSGASTLLQDLIVAQLLGEARTLIRRGLAKAYEVRDESLASPRGRIDLGAIAKGSNAWSARLPCRHHARQSDNQLNRILLGGLRLAHVIARDARLRAAVRRTLAALGAAITDVPLTRTTLAAAQRQVTRLTSSYEPALRLIEVLLDSAGISLDDDASIAVPGFLFDMNRFFQALLARLLSDGLPACKVQAESTLSSMMRYAPGKNPRQRKAPQPRPDFLVTSPVRRPALLDAKYRDLWVQGLPRDMLYQLAVYALSQPPPSQATILYPAADAHAVDAAIDIHDPVRSGARAQVVLRPVHLRSLAVAVRTGSPDSLQTLARNLAFGDG